MNSVSGLRPNASNLKPPGLKILSINSRLPVRVAHLQSEELSAFFVLPNYSFTRPSFDSPRGDEVSIVLPSA